MIEKMIDNFLQNVNAKKYLIESINIAPDIEKIILKSNEVIFLITDKVDFYTADDVFDSANDKRKIVQVNGYIIFSTTNPSLEAYKITIIEKKEKPEITLILNENKEITGVKF